MAETWEDFVAAWQTDPLQAKTALLAFRELLTEPGVRFAFKARPKISYSLRAAHAAQKKRELFVLMDVIDDDPEQRWLSVCFYADMVSDPDERGDFVPKGLLGEDACCFNYEEHDPAMQAYIADRLREALAHAKS
ncbi:MAG: hypothetical protein IKN64_08255 [Desulfovibrio sp.]|nr:hypothetical protein [Desulfovibrio sp.]